MWKSFIIITTPWEPFSLFHSIVQQLQYKKEHLEVVRIFIYTNYSVEERTSQSCLCVNERGAKENSSMVWIHKNEFQAHFKYLSAQLFRGWAKWSRKLSGGQKSLGCISFPSFPNTTKWMIRSLTVWCKLLKKQHQKGCWLLTIHQDYKMLSISNTRKTWSLHIYKVLREALSSLLSTFNISSSFSTFPMFHI